ncbi:MAG TPA: transglycosylase SLT domain-containing protein [Sphingobium sp.]|uniref:transglycosylase SLT domain-containing protein n=1 Tax=Sphingobium sp. TaxID=1912891 RepID=UPI002ED07A3D
MSDNAFDIEITASNRTEKGAKDAEKRLVRIPNAFSKSAQKSFGSFDSAVQKSGKGALGTFSKIERGIEGVARKGARSFGGSGGKGGGMGAGVLSALTELVSVGEAAGASMGEAAVAGGLLEATLGTLGVAAAVTAAVVVGLAVATDQVASSWAKGVVGMSNLANTIGVGTKALQEFQGAAERVGVDGNTAGGALAGLSKTLNDAKYNKNRDALFVLRRLGVDMKTKDDGTVDVEAMLPDIANAINRQNSSGRRTAANYLGIGEAALPIFAQGGELLQEDMRDVEKHGKVAPDEEVGQARRWHRTRTRMGQMLERQQDRFSAGLATQNQGILDSATAFLANTMDTGGDNILRGAKEFAEAVSKDFSGAVDTFKKTVEGTFQKIKDWVGPIDPGGDIADRIEHLGERSRQNQVSPKGAAGVMQLLPGTARQTAAWGNVQFDEHRYRTDENYNRMLGRLYIDRLRQQLNTNNPAIIAAAYNAGPGMVLDWLHGANKTGKNPSRRMLPDPRNGAATNEQFIAAIPFKETHDYAARVTNGMPSRAGWQGGSPSTSAAPAGGGKTGDPDRIVVENHHHFTIDDKRIKASTTSTPALQHPKVSYQFPAF